jgi:hypothetical protein
LSSAWLLGLKKALSGRLLKGSFMKKLLLILALVISFQVHAAPFQGSEIPSGVYILPCDGNPRISVTFDNDVPSVWYSLKGLYAKEFLSVALAAKASKSKLYFYGSNDVSTPYCIAQGNARQIYMIGMQ